MNEINPETAHSTIDVLTYIPKAIIGFLGNLKLALRAGVRGDDGMEETLPQVSEENITTMMLKIRRSAAKKYLADNEKK